VGPITPTVAGEATYTGRPTTDSGRVTALALSPRCGGEDCLLLVGAVIVGIGVTLALIGANSFKGSALVPDRTIEQLRADYTVAKEHVS